MRIFSYWSRTERNVQIDGAEVRLHCYGGSDLSIADAAQDGQRRLACAADRIRGIRLRNEDYEADIREEITARIDDRNVVTRNRYGAEVLNSSKLMFVDIDEPRYTLWEVFFGRGGSLAKRKERIVEFVRKRAASPELRGLGLRIYETHKGIRVIVTGRDFDPKAPATRKLLRNLNADHIYTLLCAKQGCFRARLTPKPGRMKCTTHRVIFPRDDEQSKQTFQTWLTEYQRVRQTYATCRFLCTVGSDNRNAVVDYHDRTTGAFSKLKLA